MSELAPGDARTCVVTGASSGIGLALSLGLARAGQRVVLVARDPARGRQAVQQVASVARGPEPTLVLADLSTLAGMRDAADRLRAACPRLDVLVNNAGIWPTRRELTVDGFEAAFAVNHLAPFVLNEALEPRLRESAPSRMVQVTAGLYAAGRIDLDRGPTGADFHRFRTYASTKLWNLVATMERARQWADGGVLVHAVHPGVVRTRLGDAGGILGALLRVVKRFWSTPETGARGPLRLALDPTLAGQTGLYHDREHVATLAPVLHDRSLAAAVIARTRSLVG